MRAFVGVTDNAWFKFLAALPLTEVDEVNFWQPGAQRFSALKPGEPFLFKLHYPENKIAGGGFFAGYSRLPCGMAWDAFGEKNGAETLERMLTLIGRHRESLVTIDTEIGCILLEQPFFFPPGEWVPAPRDWRPNIVRGKSYDLASSPDLWEAIQMRLLALDPKASDADEGAMLGEPVPVRRRLGQGSFRILVTDTYERRCAVTRERILPVLQAAHIRPVAAGGRHLVENGLLLRSDVHTLFDRGYLTVTPNHRLRVSRHLRDDFHNGEYYFQMDGSEIWMPTHAEDRPDPELLDWHSSEVFRG